MTSRITAKSCFDVVSAVLAGVVTVLVTADSCDFAFDGVPTFLDGLDGVPETVVGFATSLVGFVSPSIASFACVLFLISSTLAHFCSNDELESDAKLAKLLLRFRLVLVSCRSAACDEIFGNVFGAEEQS